MLRILTAVLALSLAAAAPALADQGKGKGKGSSNSGEHTSTTTEDIVEGVAVGVLGAILSDDERRIIHRYFGEHPETVKVKELPRGIRKKLARGGALPPGIAMQVLPEGLHRQLPPRSGQHYEIIGSDVVLVETATRVIVDVLKDVLRGG
jgi:Ni/Co efflux regulator RcnB